MTPSASTHPYKHHRFPGEMISHAVWLYVRWFCRKFCSGGHAGQLPLSVEEMRQPGRRRGLSMNGAENWESVATVEALTENGTVLFEDAKNDTDGYLKSCQRVK